MTDAPRTSPPPASADKKHWLDEPQNIDKIFWGIIVLCVGLMLVEPFYHKHPYFSFEGSFGFYGWFAFLACAGLVLVARAMSRILGRREDYYGTGGNEKEDNG